MPCMKPLLRSVLPGPMTARRPPRRARSDQLSPVVWNRPASPGMIWPYCMGPLFNWVPLDVDNQDSAVTALDGKLARFLSGPVQENYWSNHWQREGQLADRIRRADANDLGPYEALFGKPDVREGLVLEAGCGTGYVAEIMRRRGYRVLAVDFDAV